MPLRPTDPGKEDHSNRYYLLRYGGMAFQLLAALLLSILAGIKIDKWLMGNSDLFRWLLPLVVVVGLVVKVWKDTSPRK